MPLWLSALLLIVCAGGAVWFAVIYRKNKQLRYIIFVVLTALIGTALLAYMGLIFIFVGSRLLIAP